MGTMFGQVGTNKSTQAQSSTLGIWHVILLGILESEIQAKATSKNLTRSGLI